MTKKISALPSATDSNDAYFEISQGGVSKKLASSLLPSGEIPTVAVTGAANTKVGTVTPAITEYEDGMQFIITNASANISATTLNLNGIGAVPIVKNGNVALTAGELNANGVFLIMYKESIASFVIVNPITQVGTGLIKSNHTISVNPTYVFGTRSISITSTDTLIPDITNYELFAVDEQAEALYIDDPSGGLSLGNRFRINILDDGNAQTITFGAAYSADFIALPTTTIAGKRMKLMFEYNGSTFDLINVLNEL